MTGRIGGTAFAVALCLIMSAGCTADTAPAPSAEPGPQPDVRQRYALEATVGYLHTWSRHHLYTALDGRPRTGSISPEAWRQALQRAVDGAMRVHLNCDSADLTVHSADTVEIEMRGCRYPAVTPGASSGVATLATARGCVTLAVPTGSVDAFLQQHAVDLGFASPPSFVDSAAPAGAGTWHVGRCR